MEERVAYFCAAVPVDGPHQCELGQDVGYVRDHAEDVEIAHCDQTDL